MVEKNKINSHKLRLATGVKRFGDAKQFLLIRQRSNMRRHAWRLYGFKKLYLLSFCTPNRFF
jgi:hypothetical protein